jgi:hypothetical protein
MVSVLGSFFGGVLGAVESRASSDLPPSPQDHGVPLLFGALEFLLQRVKAGVYWLLGRADSDFRGGNRC